MVEQAPSPQGSYWRRYLAWLIAGAALSVAIASIAATLNFYRHAPIGILSLGEGVALAAGLAWLARWQSILRGRALLIGSIGVAIITVLAQHAWLYGRFLQRWHGDRAENAQVAMFRPAEPWSPREYLSREIEAGSLIYWCLDAALIIAATVVTLRFLLSHNETARAEANPDT
jgi:hypothetical protein